MIHYRMEEFKNKSNGPMPFAMLLTRLYYHILQKNPQAIVPLNRFMFHERVMNPLDISRNPIKEKGNRVASPSSSSSLSSSSDGNEAPSFLEFYKELSDNEDLTDAQREKREMFKCLNRYFGTITKAYDGEINLGVEENMISNKYAVKLCLEHEVKRETSGCYRRNSLLHSEVKFILWKFIINPEEDDVEPGVIFGRSFLTLNLWTMQLLIWCHVELSHIPDIDPFLEEEHRKKEKKHNNGLGQCLIFNIDDYTMIGTSSSAGGHLTQEEAAKEALAIRISQKLEGQVNENALADTGSDINTMPYRIYKQLGREDMKKVDRGITMINHHLSRSMGILTTYSLLWEHTMMRLDHHDPNALDNMKPWKRYCFHKFTMSSCYEKGVTEMQSLGLREAGSNEEIFTSVSWIRAFNINEPIYAELCHEFYSTYEFDKVCADDELQTKKIIKFRLGGRAHSLTLLEFARRLGLDQAGAYNPPGYAQPQYNQYYQQYPQPPQYPPQ
ncbi:hypothetical protein Tco_0589080 [Tanacetum coccineum]